MEIRYTVHVSEAQARFEHIGQRAGNFESVLKRWGGFFKARALERADAADGWAPLKESTLKKLQHTRRAKITAQGQIRSSYGGTLERYLKREKAKAELRASLGGTDNPARFSADLNELRRLRSAGAGAVDRDARGRAVNWRGSKAIDRLRKNLVKAEKEKDRILAARQGVHAAGEALAVARGRGDAAGIAKAQAKHDRTAATAGQRLRSHVGGDATKAGGHQMLGRVARSLQWRIDGSKVSAYSKVPWSNIHNEGGTAGRGASEPPRPFLFITDEDRITLSEIVLDHLRGGSGT